MKAKHLLVATALFASTLSITPTSFTKAQEIKSKEEVWVDYDYSEIKDLPSKVNFDFTDSDEISIQDISTIAFGTGYSYVNRDGLTWYGTHATSISKGKGVLYFSVFGELLRQPKGNTKLQLLDQDNVTVYSKNDGIATITTRSGIQGESGDKYISKSVHAVNLGLTHDRVSTMEEVILK